MESEMKKGANAGVERGHRRDRTGARRYSLVLSTCAEGPSVLHGLSAAWDRSLSAHISSRSAPGLQRARWSLGMGKGAQFSHRHKCPVCVRSYRLTVFYRAAQGAMGSSPGGVLPRTSPQRIRQKCWKERTLAYFACYLTAGETGQEQC